MNPNSLESILMNQYQPFDPAAFLKEHDFSISNYKPGIVCSMCHYVGLEETPKSGWNCPSCHTFDGQAHVDALIDFCMIFDQYITVPQVQWFLSLSSLTKAYELLLSLELSPVIIDEVRKYDLKPILTDEYLGKRELKKLLSSIFISD
ncbi:hypothetical protein [Halalkalibacillus halophilus]|uniref:hypothetical protein n=1 Tax=Halalkalibacillus halophilus TaxID=392827 RepID=UPI0004057C03|nr:hypothetical protein [Halalkalibacillus halophilus]